jgi:hypothetical protein
MGLVVTGGSTSPFGVGNFPNNLTDAGTSAPLINTEIVKKSFPTMINYLLPKGDATLFGLTAKMQEEIAVQIEHGFFSKIMIFPSFTVNGTIADGTTGAVTVLDSSQLVPNGLYKVVGTSVAGVLTPATTYASEIVLVTAINSATSITVVRNVGTSAGPTYTSLPTTSTLVHIGNAFADASTRPNSFLTKEIRVVNYTQIFRNAWMISGTVSAIQNLLGDTNLSKSKRECSQYHAMDIEKSLFFGIKGLTTAANMRTMNGVVSQITDGQAANLFLPGTTQAANIVSANSAKSGVATAGDLSIDDFENWIDTCVNMSYDPASGMERVLFVGKQAHNVINRLMRLNTNYYLQQGATEWGLRFSRIKTTRAEVILIEHPLLNTNLQYARMAIAIDLPSLSLAYMVGRKTKSEEFNQAGIAIDSAIDASGGSLLTELTILCKNPAGCGLMLNIQKALSADGTVEH